ncbi:CHAD domain-containing protein [Chitinophaga lutea]
MLKRKKQRKYLTKRCRELRLQLHTFCHDGGEEPLHKVRVEIKKLKAFTTFTHTAALPGSLRKIFRKAGVIREAGINGRLMQQLHLQDTALQDAGEITQQFRSRYRRYDHDIRRACKKLAHGLHPVRSGRTGHWLQHQLEAVGQIMFMSETDQLHKARKKLKNLLYVLGMLGGRPAFVTKIDTSYLDRLQDAIGRWHDLAVAANLLASRGLGGKALFRSIETRRNRALALVQAMGGNFEALSYAIRHTKGSGSASG